MAVERMPLAIAPSPTAILLSSRATELAPIAIEPIFINDRMLAQRGMFTVHHDDIKPLETEFPQAVQKVVIPSSLVDAALDFLKLTNINEYSVFPDLAGIAGYLKRESGLVPRWP